MWITHNMANLTPAACYHPLIRILIVLTCSVFYSNGDCKFGNWDGTWFQSGTQAVHIRGNNISTKGECIESNGDKFLFRDNKDKCYRCVAIHEKHKNVIQYKETYCDKEASFEKSCATITGDAQLYSMFRVNAAPIECPFKGPYSFSYSRGYRECKYPLSNIDSCTEDWRILLRFQACPDVVGTESTNEELVCLANWKDGSTRYLVGKLKHDRTTSDEDKYRCFVYEKNKEHDHAVVQLAQSGDATCNGVSSPTEGSRTMKLNKLHPAVKCQFPPWVVHTHHWHTLSSRRKYHFHKNNSTMDINTSSNELETKVVCSQKVYVKEKVEMVVAHSTSGCKNGFVCMVFHKRGHHVIEVQTGALVGNQEDACHGHHFDKVSSEYVTLITQAPKARTCPYLGKYNLLNAKRQLRQEREACPGVSTLRVGCDRVDTIEFETDCPTEQKIESYECHANWHENGTNYLITSVKGTDNRYCFVYTEIDKVLQFSSLQDSCRRNVQPGISGIMAFNVTSNGHCGDIHDGISSNSPAAVVVVALVSLSSFLSLLR